MADYLLIDFGSTNIKYSIYCTKKSNFLISASFPFPDKMPNTNELFFEVDPHKITDILHAILNSITLDSLSGIIISVQMHGYILADLKGTPITPYISWRDKRSCVKFHGRTYYEMFENKNIVWSERGTSCKKNLPLINLFAQKHLFPHMFMNDIEFYTLGSSITYILTGKNATHITDCAATGMYNAETCEQTEDSHIIFPQAFKDVEIVGKFKGIPVYSPVGDHQASFLGSDVEGTQYLLNIGTATNISTLSYEKGELYECRPYFGDIRICTITNLIGGRTIRENPDICDELIENYLNAIKSLPKKDNLLVCGGTVNYYPKLIENVCSGIGMPYQIRQNNSAIGGLKKIAEEADENG